MRRRTKLLFGLVTMLVIFTGLEGCARAYSRFRHGNPVAFRYGFDLARRIADGTVALDIGWGAGRGGKTAGTRETNSGADAEAIFNNRSDKNDGLVLTAPQRIVNFNGGFSATLNSLSFRGPEVAPDIPAGTHRIAVFGGSYVFGAYLRDDQTWAHLLQTGLRARGAAVEVVNAGTSGANVHGVLTDVIRLTNRARINTAVITTGYNNHPLLPVERRYTTARRLDFYLYNSSLFYVMVKERLAKLASQPLDYGLYRQPMRVNAADVEWLLELYTKRLNQIATVCEERGIRVVYASEAERFFSTELNARSSQDDSAIAELAAKVQRDGELTVAEAEAYLQGRLNRAARDVAAARGALFFDGEAVLLGDKQRTFADQIHPNEIGAAKLAKGLEELLLPVVTAQAETAKP
jgi:lysophospholipase L1-like esterase